jgi:hypothetical protein
MEALPRFPAILLHIAEAQTSGGRGEICDSRELSELASRRPRAASSEQLVWQAATSAASRPRGLTGRVILARYGYGWFADRTSGNPAALAGFFPPDSSSDCDVSNISIASASRCSSRADLAIYAAVYSSRSPSMNNPFLQQFISLVSSGYKIIYIYQATDRWICSGPVSTDTRWMYYHLLELLDLAVF